MPATRSASSVQIAPSCADDIPIYRAVVPTSVFWTRLSGCDDGWGYYPALLALWLVVFDSRQAKGDFFLILFVAHQRRRNPDRSRCFPFWLVFHTSDCQIAVSAFWRGGERGYGSFLDGAKVAVRLMRGNFSLTLWPVIKIAKGKVKNGCWKLILKFWNSRATTATQSSHPICTQTWRFHYFLIIVYVCLYFF